MFLPRKLTFPRAFGPGAFLPRARGTARALLAAGLCAGATFAAAQSPEPLKLRAEVAVPLQQAQEALRANTPAPALAAAQKALAVPALTAQERQVSLRVLAAAAHAARDWPVATGALKELLALPGLPERDRTVMTETLLQALWQQQDHAAFAATARAHLQAGAQNPAVFTLLLRALAAQGDDAGVVREARARLERLQAAGTPPADTDLVLLAQALHRLQDASGYADALVLLVTHHPRPERWNEAIRRVADLPGFSSRLDLDIHRLLDKVGQLAEADLPHFVAAADKAGLPCEARRVLPAGPAREAMQKKCDAERAQLPALAQSARDANALKSLADVQASQQDWQAAAASYARAAAAGGARRPDELRLHHGIALLQAGDKEAARAQLAQVQGDDGARRVARLWLALAR
ncbi:hypothetical protein ACT80S_11625 [Ramlibacter sp. MAHUQ-53]|uniref:hypothetical protein n=1 Tax=unclassified Ramlibacter TaxID=2617605 RepID=UPI00362A6E3B